MRALVLALAVALAATAGGSACGRADNGGVIDGRATTTAPFPGRY